MSFSVENLDSSVTKLFISDELEQNINKETSIDILDNDSLLHIFKFLSIKDTLKLPIVCKRWHTLSKFTWSSFPHINSSTLIRQIVPNSSNLIYTINKNNINFFWFILSNCGPYLNSIKVFFDNDLDYIYESRAGTFMLPLIGNLCPNLKSVIITSSHIVMYHEITALAENCKNIQVLKLLITDHFIEENHIYIIESESELFKLFKNNNKLKTVKLKLVHLESGYCFLGISNAIENIYIYSHGVFEEYLDKCLITWKNLKSFKIKLFRNMSLEVKKNIIKTLENCHNLSKLHIDFSFSTESSIENALSELFTKLHLIDLKIENACITGKCLFNLKIDLIENIKLIKCDQIQLQCLENCLSSFKKLRVLTCLYFSYVNNTVFKKITNLKTLEILSLWEFPFQPIILCSNISSLINLKNLKILDLKSTILVDNNVIKMISNEFKKLIRLDISFATTVAEESLALLCKLPDLKELIIMGLFVTGKGLLEFKNLTILDCANCNLKKKFMIYVVKNCKNLKYLNVTSNKRICNEFIDGVIKVTNNRTNDVMLTMNVFKCEVILNDIKNYSPNLQIISHDSVDAKKYIKI